MLANSRVKMVDRELPWYGAEACLKGQKLALRVTREGRVRGRRAIGKCAPPVDARKLEQFLTERGLTQITIVDRELPVYKAEACEGDTSYRISFNRYGDELDRERLANCRPLLNQRQIVALMQGEGFKRVTVTEKTHDKYRVMACFEQERYEVFLSHSGDLLSEKNRGKCDGRTLYDLQEAYQGRGVSALTFFAEGCRKGRKFRYRLNAFGDQLARERIGRC